jgi:hypothetical protein
MMSSIVSGDSAKALAEVLPEMQAEPVHATRVAATDQLMMASIARGFRQPSAAASVSKAAR